MKMLDKFDDYTVQGNLGFKIKIGKYIVSVVCHNHLDGFSKMEEEQNGICGRNIDFSKMPSDLMAFTFCSHNVEVVVFDSETDKSVTSEFTGLSDSYDDIAYGVTPIELIDILIKVKDRL